jgi:hypothetical protein
MSDGDLGAFVERSGRLLENSPEMSERNAELRVVIPFLGTLGWDVHGTELVADYEVEGLEETVDFALVLERPEVFVVTAPPGTIDAAVGERLTRAMEAAEVDLGVATDAETYAFVARGEDDHERVSCDLAALPERTGVLEAFTRAAAVQRRERRTRETRAVAGRRLREHREAVAEDVLDRLLTATDGAARHDLEEATEAFLDRLVGVMTGDDTDEEPERSTASAGGHREAETAEPTPAAATVDRSGDGEEETEIVVRFFNEHSSVGAVGHPTAPGATAQAVQYLVEQHALNNRLDLPWALDDEDRALINYDPVHPDGTEMADPRQISNGYHVPGDLDVSTGREAVERLAERSGLRVMFQGDW